MKDIEGFKGLYSIAKDYTVIEIATGYIVEPKQDAKGQLRVKLKTQWGNTVKKNLREIYLQCYTEEGIDNDNVDRIKEEYNNGILNARVIANKLQIPLAEVQLIVMEIKNDNRED